MLLIARCKSAISAVSRTFISNLLEISGFCVKIGKNFRQFSTKNADTSEQKSNFSKFFLTYLLTSSYENLESIFEDLFRIKCAATSNYRRSVFLPSGNKKTNNHIN